MQNTRKTVATQIPPSATQFAKHEKKYGNPNTPRCNTVRKIREKLWQSKYPLVQHSLHFREKPWQPKYPLVHRSLQNTRKNAATQIPPSATQFAKHEKNYGNPNTPWFNTVCKIREKPWQPKYPLVQRSLQNTRKTVATQIPPSATQLAKHEKNGGNPNTP